jgi:hypothetical protein
MQRLHSPDWCPEMLFKKLFENVHQDARPPLDSSKTSLVAQTLDGESLAVEKAKKALIRLQQGALRVAAIPKHHDNYRLKLRCHRC